MTQRHLCHAVSDAVECRRQVAVASAYSADDSAGRSVLRHVEVVGGLVEARQLVINVDYLNDQRLCSRSTWSSAIINRHFVPTTVMRRHFFILLKHNSSNYYTLPYRPKVPFLISDIRALWRSGLSARVPERQSARMSEIKQVAQLWQRDRASSINDFRREGGSI